MTTTTYALQKYLTKTLSALARHLCMLELLTVRVAHMLLVILEIDKKYVKKV